MSKQYNHIYSICFSLENNDPNGEASSAELLNALRKRLEYLENAGDEIIEATGYPDDTYEVIN